MRAWGHDKYSDQNSDLKKKDKKIRKVTSNFRSGMRAWSDEESYEEQDFKEIKKAVKIDEKE